MDLSKFGTVHTMTLAALFSSKLGFPMKTTISANVLKDALRGTFTIRPLTIGTSVSGKVEKQCAHFFGVTILEEQAQAGIVVRVTSAAQSKFKILYFEQDAINGGYDLSLQEDSDMITTGKVVTSAGMYFLHFQVYRLDSTVTALAMAKDLKAAYFKRLEGLQPCEVSELKAGTHIFAVYGDHFSKTTSYTIEALCAKTFEDTSEKLKEIESQILRKRIELRQFETAYRNLQNAQSETEEYRNAVARYQEFHIRYRHENQTVNELLKQRDNIHSSFTTIASSGNNITGSSSSSSSKVTVEEFKAQSPGEDAAASIPYSDKSSKKKWYFNLNLKNSDLTKRLLE
ncbi:hypothetical protein AQUCO_00700601v1 [Aquilegia coerulea]|uniref:Chaperone protein dnaJ 15 n=1 Tax=Aquilegia coerulea TaxID=218851 RepID=A0A2G5EKX2_AQUCA|nr:hypothetical protein AQUCO_00700601v1 [Aquilegia coerulea]